MQAAIWCTVVPSAGDRSLPDQWLSNSMGISLLTKITRSDFGCNLFLFFTFVIIKGKNSEFWILSKGVIKPQDDITKPYTTGRMTAKTIGAILSVVKKGQQVRKGKARKCCRWIQIEWIVHIACLIFRGQLCRPPRTRNGLFVYALIWPDQVDVWDRTAQREPWDDQTNRSVWCWDCRLSYKTGGFSFVLRNVQETRIKYDQE